MGDRPLDLTAWRGRRASHLRVHPVRNLDREERRRHPRSGGITKLTNPAISSPREPVLPCRRAFVLKVWPHGVKSSTWGHATGFREVALGRGRPKVSALAVAVRARRAGREDAPAARARRCRRHSCGLPRKDFAVRDTDLAGRIKPVQLRVALSLLAGLEAAGSEPAQMPVGVRLWAQSSDCRTTVAGFRLCVNNLKQLSSPGQYEGSSPSLSATDTPWSLRGLETQQPCGTQPRHSNHCPTASTAYYRP